MLNALKDFTSSMTVCSRQSHYLQPSAMEDCLEFQAHMVYYNSAAAFIAEYLGSLARGGFGAVPA